VLVESVLASIGVMVWAAVQPGVVRDVALAVALVGGVSTLLANANPLVRMDGYHVLTDLLDLPNLAQRSRRWWFETLPWPMAYPQSGLVISVLPVLALGLFIGFAGAVLGIGGGFIVVPALIYFFRVPAAVVIGTSLWQILLTMIVATMLHAITNQSVDFVLALILIVGSVIGAQFGTRVGQTLRGEHFRLLLATLVFGVAVRFAIEVIVKPQELFSVVQQEMRQ
jgi:hypothetical protein